MLDRKEGSQEYFFVVFCTSVEALGLQVGSMHGAVPQCAAPEAREYKTHTHTRLCLATTRFVLCKSTYWGCN